jgi:hypothetical protein
MSAYTRFVCLHGEIDRLRLCECANVNVKCESLWECGVCASVRVCVSVCVSVRVCESVCERGQVCVCIATACPDHDA